MFGAYQVKVLSERQSSCSSQSGLVDQLKTASDRHDRDKERVEASNSTPLRFPCVFQVVIEEEA